MTKNIASIIEKNFNLIENNIKTINMTIARRTLDDIFKYILKDTVLKGGMNYFPSNNDKILIDDVGKYSITKPDKTHIIIDIIIKTMQTDKLVITDGTACIGGDTLAFSEKFTSVNSVELDKTRYEYLKHNMDIFGRKNMES
jgi:hypothetical protein